MSETTSPQNIYRAGVLEKVQRPLGPAAIKKLALKRDTALARARDYAKAGCYELSLIWAKSAADYFPLTEMQLWLLKKCVGDYKFTELGFNDLPQTVK